MNPSRVLLIQEIALWFNGTILVGLTIVQTPGMLFRLLRRHRGYRT